MGVPNILKIRIKKYLDAKFAKWECILLALETAVEIANKFIYLYKWLILFRLHKFAMKQKQEKEGTQFNSI